jgi:hypothetical protein
MADMSVRVRTIHGEGPSEQDLADVQPRKGAHRRQEESVSAGAGSRRRAGTNAETPEYSAPKQRGGTS